MDDYYQSIYNTLKNIEDHNENFIAFYINEDETFVMNDQTWKQNFPYYIERETELGNITLYYCYGIDDEESEEDEESDEEDEDEENKKDVIKIYVVTRP